MEDPAGEAERPGRFGLLSRVAVDLSPLRESPAFRRLWIGQAISSLGTMVTGVAVPYQVYRLTGSTLAVGLLGIAALVPLLTVPLVGGAIAGSLASGGSTSGTSLAWASRPGPDAGGDTAGDGDGAGEISIDLPVKRSLPKVGRNEPCPCGSGKKYKNCCGRTA